MEEGKGQISKIMQEAVQPNGLVGSTLDCSGEVASVLIARFTLVHI